MAAKILTVTINPAIDVTTGLAALEPGRKLRCEAPRYDPGGGGINVARMIARLGGEVAAFVVAGGNSGQLLRELCDTEGLATIWFEIPGRTRELLKVVERQSGQLYRFVLPGPEIASAAQEAILERVGELARAVDYVVASGSLAPNMPDDYHSRLARRVAEAGARCVVDTSGQALRKAVGAGLYMIKPDRHEAAALAGRPVAEAETDQEALLETLLEQNTEIAVITLGAAGALAGDRHGRRVRMRPPAVSKRGAVGAGDAFLGAAVHALAQDQSLEDAVRLAVAAAAATVQTAGTEPASRAAILELCREVTSSGTADRR